MLLCPFCCGDITQIARECLKNYKAQQKNANGFSDYFLFCNHVQSRDQSAQTDYRHSSGQPLKSDADYLVIDNEQIHPEYLNTKKSGPKYLVSVIGPSRAGKTVWIIAMGAMCVHPQVFRNWMSPVLDCKILTSANAQKNVRMEVLLRIALGELPARTEPLRKALTLPVRISPNYKPETANFGKSLF